MRTCCWITSLWWLRASLIPPKVIYMCPASGDAVPDFSSVTRMAADSSGQFHGRRW